ncbi:DUF6795 domain-containing protein [Microbulbifer halophilus]|uniref:DUF6795 domain-containing protein n=1 Tax=Microbulbifer halophilus TaxID=453963 RepID=A0ABW5EEK0_9GAMM|nr:DUF6795 domain-containing protein [Microbulbifer halophilus]MCW8128150.1 hypothetical protein [Microbulbifer halophilus]
MSVFDAGKAYLFSPSAITITQDGYPLRGAKVVRRWEWKDKLNEDLSYTDDDGVVKLEGVRELSVSQILPVQFFVAQQLSVVIDGNEEVFWENAKVSPSENSELEGSPLILNCEVNSKEKTYQLSGTELYTKCTWKDGDKE